MGPKFNPQTKISLGHTQRQSKSKTSPKTAKSDESSQRAKRSHDQENIDQDLSFLGQFSQRKRRQRIETDKKRSSESQLVLEVKGAILSHAREMKKAERLLVNTQSSSSECPSQINMEGPKNAAQSLHMGYNPNFKRKDFRAILG